MAKQIRSEIINEDITIQFREEVSKFRILLITLTNMWSQVDLWKVILYRGQRTLGSSASIEYIECITLTSRGAHNLFRKQSNWV